MFADHADDPEHGIQNHLRQVVKRTPGRTQNQQHNHYQVRSARVLDEHAKYIETNQELSALCPIFESLETVYGGICGFTFIGESMCLITTAIHFTIEGIFWSFCGNNVFFIFKKLMRISLL